MNPNDIKSKVLQQLMDAMDERMVGDLKSKSPKFAKVDIQSDDPKLADELKNKLMGAEGSDEEEQSESPAEMLKEKMHPELEAKESNHEEQDPDLEKLLELYKSLK